MIGCVFAAVIYCLAMGISWAMTCGIVYLVSLCFDFTFTWALGSGIWLVLCLVSAFFKSSSSSKK